MSPDHPVASGFSRVLPLTIVLVAAALRFYPLGFGLPYAHARPDEDAALGHAAAILREGPNPHFFHWPSLTFYVLAAVFRIAEFAGPEATSSSFDDHVLVGRAVVAFAGTATVFVLLRLGTRIAGPTAGVLSAGFLAVALLHVRESHFAMTDVLMTLFLLVALGVVVDAVTSDLAPNVVRLSAAGGFAAGLATGTKYSAAAVAAAMIAAQALWFVRRPALATTWRGWLPIAAFGAAMAGGFLTATPFALLDFEQFARDVLFDVEHLSSGHGADLGRGWSYHLVRSLPYGAGLGACAAAMAGVVPFARRHPRAATVIGAFALAFYAGIGSGQTVFFRYVLPLVPVVALVAGIGVEAAASLIARRTRVPHGAALGLLAALTIGPGLVQSAWFDVVLARTDTRVLAGEWLAARVQPGDSVYDSGREYVRLELGDAPIHRWWFDESSGTFGDPDGRTPTWLVIHESPLSQYTTPPPAVAVLARQRYTIAFHVRGTRAESDALYDQQDAFFMPMSDFGSIPRPGPTIRIFRRVP